MRKTIIGGIFLVSSFLMSLFSVQVYGEQNLSCIVYVNQLKKTRREYKDSYSSEREQHSHCITENNRGRQQKVKKTLAGGI